MITFFYVFQVFLFVALFVFLAKDPGMNDDDLLADTDSNQEVPNSRRSSSISSIPDIRPKEPGYIRPLSPSMIAMRENTKSIIGLWIL